MNKGKLLFTVLVWVSVLCALPALAAQVHLAWGPSSGEVTGYRIYYGTSQGNHPNKIEVGNVTDYIVTGLADGVTYYFVTRAYNAYGESADSNEINWSSSVADTTPPGDVTNFAASPDVGQVALAWTNPSDSDFAGVMIRYRTDGTYPTSKTDGSPVPNGNSGKISGKPGASGNFVHTGLDPSKTYYYSAFSYDTAGNYSHTAHVSATPLPPPAPANQAPVITSFTAVPNPAKNPHKKINFSVQATDPDGDALTYTIKFGDGSSDATGSTATHAYSTKGTYTAITTVNDSHGHSVSKTLQVTVNDAVPAKPTGVQAKN